MKLSIASELITGKKIGLTVYQIWFDHGLMTRKDYNSKVNKLFEGVK